MTDIAKGGLFIYTLTNFESRATIDVDFLLRGYSNSIDDVKDLIYKIIDTQTGNDYIEMITKGFEEISPQRKYHGISTQIIGQIKNVRVPFNVDIGVGDVIVPKAEQRKINTQLSEQAAIFETLQRRGTSYDRDSFKRIVALADDEDMQKRWKFFLKTIKDDMIAFFVVITEIQTFLEPVFEAIVNEDEWKNIWESNVRKWSNLKGGIDRDKIS